MTRALLTILSLLLLSIATRCQEQISFDVVTITDDNLQPEGFAYSSRQGFLVSSIVTGQLYQLQSDNGDLRLFGSCEKCSSALGIAVNEDEGLIYVADTGAIFGRGVSTQGGVSVYKESNGELVTYHNFTNAFNTTLPKLINGVTFDKQGNIYATDSFNGNIYVANADGSTGLYVGSTDTLGPQDELGLGANGIAYYSRGGKEYLIVVRSGLTTSTLFRIDLDKPLEFIEILIEFDSSVYYEPQIFDGCVFDAKNNLLYVVGNINQYVYEFASEDNWESCTLIRAVNVDYQNPASVTISSFDDQVYVNCLNGFSEGSFESGPYYLEQIDGLDRSPVVISTYDTVTIVSSTATTSSSSASSVHPTTLFFALISIILLSL